MKILITGYKGYIGNALLARLLQENKHTITVLDRGDKFPKDSKIDLVYHLAANPKVLESIENPLLALENISYTTRLLIWMKKTRVPNIIFASTTEIDGKATPYSASKRSCENMIKAFCQTYGMSAVSLRFSNIYGPNDRNDRFIPSAISKARNGEEIEIYGDKGNFLYIQDCVDAYIEAQKLIKLGQHQIFKLKGQEMKLIDVAKKIVELTESKSKITMNEALRKMING